MLNEFHVSHRSIVAIAEAHLQDAGVAALTIGETRGNLIEQLDDNIAVTKTIESQTLVGDGRFLGERDQGLNDTAQFLGLGQGSANSFVRNERAGHVAKHGGTVSRSTVELAIAVMVTHFLILESMKIMNRFQNRNGSARTLPIIFYLQRSEAAGWGSMRKARFYIIAPFHFKLKA